VGGVHVGTFWLNDATPVPIREIETAVHRAQNAADWAALEVFDQLVKRDDKIELLTYNAPGGQRYFASIDYGFSFGGTPNWDQSTLASIDVPFLRYDGTTQLCQQQAPIIARLSGLTTENLREAIHHLLLPRFGMTADLAEALAQCLESRARSLVAEHAKFCR